MTTGTKLLPFLAAASLVGGCSRTGLDLGISDSFTEPDGAVINGDDSSLFVGRWICKDTDTTTLPGQPIFYTTDLLTFVADSDGTLTMTGETLAGPGASVDPGPCTTFTFYPWGSTATASGGVPCSLNDGNTVTTVSGSFVVSGSTATFNLVRKVTGSPPGTNTVTGTCTRLVPDAGSD
jgi:hypothetical protein